MNVGAAARADRAPRTGPCARPRPQADRRRQTTEAAADDRDPRSAIRGLQPPDLRGHQRDFGRDRPTARAQIVERLLADSATPGAVLRTRPRRAALAARARARAPSASPDSATARAAACSAANAAASRRSARPAPTARSACRCADLPAPWRHFRRSRPSGCRSRPASAARRRAGARNACQRLLAFGGRARRRPRRGERPAP